MTQAELDGNDNDDANTNTSNTHNDTTTTTTTTTTAAEDDAGGAREHVSAYVVYAYSYIILYSIIWHHIVLY